MANKFVDFSGLRSLWAQVPLEVKVKPLLSLKKRLITHLLHSFSDPFVTTSTQLYNHKLHLLKYLFFGKTRGKIKFDMQHHHILMKMFVQYIHQIILFYLHYTASSIRIYCSSIIYSKFYSTWLTIKFSMKGMTRNKHIIPS